MCQYIKFVLLGLSFWWWNEIVDRLFNDFRLINLVLVAELELDVEERLLTTLSLTSSRGVVELHGHDLLHIGKALKFVKSLDHSGD